ncbi:uncharacterized protein At4g15545 isoform X2 [Physcomitrium patens]|uniref:uncharacterized protein At4g15545 isoform X2 n=1 Tax=Physcomitrium patens TaxID=3218 RepID=UPI000D15F44C|nr:uncharacterized protein At4g15545-like [Physcomitrium patens]|eukprot:XP_024365201.1 uncharacterized protein At4g15545-like [Physcomitrella patens]
MSKAGEMQLADGILMNLPEHPDQQLEIAQQITRFAVSGRVANLEGELDCLTLKLVEKAAIVEDLQARVSAVESMLGGITAKLAVALQDQAKLAEVKDALADQMKTLMCQVSVLDDFKKAVVRSLGPNSDFDDNPGDATYAYAPEASASTYCSSEKSLLQLPLIMSKSTEPPTPTKRKQQGQYSCMMLTSQDSPRDSAKGEESDKWTDNYKSAGAISEKSQWECPLTPRLPSDTGPAKSRRIDGKEVFRRARARWTCEQFSDFLNNIREVNALRRAEEALELSSGVFHPNTFSCKTHSPPNSGDWVIMSGIR